MIDNCDGRIKEFEFCDPSEVYKILEILVLDDDASIFVRLCYCSHKLTSFLMHSHQGSL